jgi:hypothetical protein
VSLFGFCLSDISQYFKSCRINDPNVNVCVKNQLNGLRQYFHTGIPELNLQPIEPLLVQQLNIDNDNGNFRLNGKYKNIVIKGASGIYITDVRTDLKNLRIDAKLTIPKLEARGNFDVQGQAILLPIVAKGNFALELTGVTAIAKFFAKEVYRNNVAYLQIDRFYIDYSVKGAKIKISDQFSPQITEIINTFLNQNAILLVQETRASTAKAIAPIFRNLLQNVLNTSPMSSFFTK